ncbi:enoyl-CoA hydratase/isomerase family protein [Sphingobacterium sp. SYP-B4668]|uniref:enoyl-CoA hydratase/isomerase family protein n=1 Tax=Sphingobacterium sp. SYP-B4668 TaxID=2996035 RepID=UPI0022DE8453|nr:enoyl-CoA hydratase/isomerase family protein [Sphingobacterium sp. SYP-B4668]
MEFIKVNIEERIAHIALDRGKSNAMHLEMIEELASAIKQAEENPAIEGLILHGKENFFTSGLDLITLYQYNEQQMETFWTQFLSLIHQLAAFPKPAVAAISGHSPAGGCVLGICCDYRVMAQGDFIVGLNEVPVGIVVPESIFELYSFWIGKRRAYQYLLEGKLLKPEEALEVGLVDELVSPISIKTAALRKIKLLTQFEKNAWRTTKLNLRKNLLHTIKTDQAADVAQALQQWWAPSTRAVLKTIIENLTAKKP